MSTHNGFHKWYDEASEDTVYNKVFNSIPKVCKKVYKTYKGIHKPRCCGGTGCQVCWLIYEAKHDQ